MIFSLLAVSADSWIALGSMIVAVCALFVSVQQHRMQRTHDRLSVRPKLDSTIDRTREDDSKLIYALTIENKGLGPAVIIDRRLYLDGREVHDDGPYTVFRIFRELFPSDHIAWIVNSSVPGVGSSMKSGETKVIFRSQFQVRKENEADFLKPLYRAEVEFDYESIYGEKHTFTTKGLPR